MEGLTFHKYHGTGNDFVIFDGRGLELKAILSQEKIANICHRRFGVGADGVMILQNHDDFDFEMIYYNADGRPSSMCGNGGRCLVAFAANLGVIDDHCSFLATDGPHEAIIKDDIIELKMGDVDQVEQLGEDYILDTGSPHYIKPINDLSKLDVVANAHAIRYSDRFKEVGINVNFLQSNKEGIRIRTYERGVEDETWACGTGATAAAIAHVLEKDLSGDQKINVKVEGGNLQVKMNRRGQHVEDIWLCGPATFVFKGLLDI